MNSGQSFWRSFAALLLASQQICEAAEAGSELTQAAFAKAYKDADNDEKMAEAAWEKSKKQTDSLLANVKQNLRSLDEDLDRTTREEKQKLTLLEEDSTTKSKQLEAAQNKLNELVTKHSAENGGLGTIPTFSSFFEASSKPHIQNSKIDEEMRKAIAEAETLLSSDSSSPSSSYIDIPKLKSNAPSFLQLGSSASALSPEHLADWSASIEATLNKARAEVGLPPKQLASSFLQGGKSSFLQRNADKLKEDDKKVKMLEQRYNDQMAKLRADNDKLKRHAQDEIREAKELEIKVKNGIDITADDDAASSLLENTLGEETRQVEDESISESEPHEPAFLQIQKKEDSSLQAEDIDFDSFKSHVDTGNAAEDAAYDKAEENLKDLGKRISKELDNVSYLEQKLDKGEDVSNEITKVFADAAQEAGEDIGEEIPASFLQLRDVRNVDSFGLTGSTATQAEAEALRRKGELDPSKFRKLPTGHHHNKPSGIKKVTVSAATKNDEQPSSLVQVKSSADYDNEFFAAEHKLRELANQLKKEAANPMAFIENASKSSTFA